MKRAAVYTRISQDRADTALGVQRQERDCREKAAALGWDVADVYTDNSVSATSSRARPEFDRLLRDIEGGYIQAVVVWDIDRLTRKPAELEQIIALFERHDLALASVGGWIDISTEQGRLTARIKGSVAKHEAEQTSRRARAKHAELAAKGLPSGGGTRPYGFAEDRITHVESEAEVIQAAADLVLNGLSLRATCRYLNEREVPTATGKMWSTNVLRNMLTGPRVAGYREHNGNLTEAVWGPIIDRPTWEQLRTELGCASRTTTRVFQRQHHWTGLLRCWRCDGYLGVKQVNGSASYTCRSSHFTRWDATRKGGCQGTSIRKEQTDRVLDDLLLTAIEEETLGEMHPRLGLDETEVAIADLETRLDVLAESFASGELAVDAYRAASLKVTTRLDESRAKLRQARSRVATAVTLDPRVVRAKWGTLAPVERRNLAALLIDRVTVQPVKRRGDNRFDPARLQVIWR